jgi:hypothetical protein
VRNLGGLVVACGREQVRFSRVGRPERTLQAHASRSIYACTPKPDNIEPKDPGAVARRQAIGRDIERDHGVCSDERKGADADELVHACVAAESDAVADLNVAGEAHAVREDTAIAQTRVVPDVSAGHQQVLGP